MCALGVAEEDGTTPTTSNADMENLRQRVILVLLQQLSASRDRTTFRGLCLYLLKCGIITYDALPELRNLQTELGVEAVVTKDVSGALEAVSKQPCSEQALSRFEQDFERLELLGRGAFGEVWRCKHRLDGREYAVKAVKYLTNGADGGRLERRVLREAQTMANLDMHPGVVRYHTSWLEVAQASGTDSCAGSFTLLPTDLASHRLDGGDISTANETYLSNPFDVDSDGVTFSEERDVSLGSSLALSWSTGDSLGELEFESLQECKAASIRPCKVGETKLVMASKQEQHQKQQLATLYIQTELCDKNTLEKWISDRNEEVTSMDKKCAEHAQWSKASSEIFKQCIDAAAHLHTNQCVHRDLKPSNILFGAGGQVQLGDFGLAKTSGAFSDTDDDSSTDSTVSTLSEHTRGLGTPTYASPEQLNGGVYGLEIDVFALGVILVELLCPVKTQMERAVLLEELRRSHRLPDDVRASYPVSASLAIAMTDADSKKRPSIHDVLQIMPEVLCEMQEPGEKAKIVMARPLQIVDTIEVAKTHVCDEQQPEEQPQDKVQGIDAQESQTPPQAERQGEYDDHDLQAQSQGESQNEKVRHPLPNIMNPTPSEKDGHRRDLCKSSSRFRVDLHIFLLFFFCRSAIIPGPISNDACTQSTFTRTSSSLMFSFGQSTSPGDENLATFKWSRGDQFVDVTDMEGTQQRFGIHQSFVEAASEISEKQSCIDSAPRAFGFAAENLFSAVFNALSGSATSAT